MVKKTKPKEIKGTESEGEKKPTRQQDKILKEIRKKGLDLATVKEIVEQVKHPKAKKKVIDLSDHLKDGHIRFGVISDTHLNNRYARTKDILPTCYSHFRAQRADFVVHCGDISDGCFVRNRPVDEMLYVGYDDILRHIVTEYPRENGMKTYFIGGNADYTFLKKMKKDQRRNICEDIDRVREDLVFVGMTEADIKLAPKTTLKLLHPLPSMGTRKPYTISYPLQKIINTFEGGEKPDIMCVGYYHRMYQFKWRDVHAFIAGTTQNQSPHMRAHQLGSEVGAWFLDVEIEKGKMKQVEYEVIPFYK